MEKDNEKNIQNLADSIKVIESNNTDVPTQKEHKNKIDDSNLDNIKDINELKENNKQKTNQKHHNKKKTGRNENSPKQDTTKEKPIEEKEKPILENTRSNEVNKNNEENIDNQPKDNSEKIDNNLDNSSNDTNKSEDADNKEVKEKDDVKIDDSQEEIIKELNQHVMHKKQIIVSVIAVVLIVAIFFAYPMVRGKNKTENKKVVQDETTVVQMALDELPSFNQKKLNKYFKETNSDWFDELDFTSNLAKSETLKNAKNLSKLEKVKGELLKTVLPTDLKKIKVSENGKNSVVVSFKAKVVKLDEVTKNIVSGLLTVSIESGKDNVDVNKLVNSYVDAFSTVTKTEYTKTTENMSVELTKKDGKWVIKDFRRFINTVIPDGNFYKDYIDSLNSGKTEKEANTEAENKSEDNNSDTVAEKIAEQ